MSIVLTAYNRAEPLRRTMETLIEQTFKDFELLVCDDASVDHTEAVVQEYKRSDARIIYQRNIRNAGMPENLNQGIRRSRGKYIANLHDGDIYSRTLLERWVDALHQYPTAAFVFNQYRFLNALGQTDIVRSEALPPVFPGVRLLEDIYFCRWRFDSPVWGTVMARRSAYLQAGLFDQRFGCIADVDMWMRLAEIHDVAYIAEPLITLPSRESIPGNWVIPRTRARQIFWEARMRRFRRRPLRKFLEAGRHAGFAAASEAYFGACRLKGILRKHNSHPSKQETA